MRKRERERERGREGCVEAEAAELERGDDYALSAPADQCSVNAEGKPVSLPLPLSLSLSFTLPLSQSPPLPAPCSLSLSLSLSHCLLLSHAATLTHLISPLMSARRRRGVLPQAAVTLSYFFPSLELRGECGTLRLTAPHSTSRHAGETFD